MVESVDLSVVFSKRSKLVFWRGRKGVDEKRPDGPVGSLSGTRDSV